MERLEEFINKKIDVYSNNFTNEQLQEFEDVIFTKKIDKKKRAEFEIDRLKNTLIKEESLYAEYFEEIMRISKLLKVSDFDSTVLDDIYATIFKICLECDIKPRLYSAIPILMRKYEKDYFSLEFKK